MNNLTNKILAIFTALALGILASCDDDNGSISPIDKPDIEFYALGKDMNKLWKFNAMNSETEISNVTISGLTSGERIVAIDFRPATGQLYGLTSASRLYIINHTSGVATPLSVEPISPTLSGEILGFDFNPTVDRIRVVTAGGQNLRLNPETGSVAAVDGAINPSMASIAAVAYTNSVAGASSTTLFDIDLSERMLYKQDPPNDGTLVAIGELKLKGDESDASFDISSDNSVALAATSNGSTSTLYSIDLESGKASNLGDLPALIGGIAIPTPPVAYAVSASGMLQIINLNSVGTPTSKAITGLTTGEGLLGIDMRPATGQLYALGSTSRLYTINMASGAALPVGTEMFSTALDGEFFGFDFNPTVDRIRVVSNTGQNLRLHPATGAVVAVDIALNPGSPAISSAAYINNFPGAMTTTLFDIDYSSDKLLSQIPPNGGVLIEVGSLGINVEAGGGFDIGGISNSAYAIFSIGSITKIYTINTTTGAASPIADYPNQVVGFTIGVGF